MMLVPLQQRRKLGSHELTRDGIDLAGGLAETARPMACWNFALTGTLVAMDSPVSTNAIYNGNADNLDPARAILDVDPWGQHGCLGKKLTATALNHPESAAEINIIDANIAAAIGGNGAAQVTVAEAMLCILALKNGLTPRAAADTYKLHMAAENWYTWDHFSLSFAAVQPGRPRIHMQTVTREPLSHACTNIWDEHKDIHVSVNINLLHEEQVALINTVADYGVLCVLCGAQHGYFKSIINMWHRCTTCNAVYCANCGGRLPGKLGWRDYTRRCNQALCPGRTQLIENV